MSTIYHAKYFSHELTRHHSGSSVQKISQSLFDACVDLNPHQIEAALFALRSPLSRGIIMADEVGLGKTIEAGILLCQYWAERKRKMLIICPASLRKQWSIELFEKFHLPSVVLDSKTCEQAARQGRSNPFDCDSVVIVSIHFASRYATKLRTILWDLVVIDEAHQLRNVYKSGNKMAKEIKWALENKKKLLLTATPLQNSLLELYGLGSIIDEHLFGEIDVFRSQFTGNQNNLNRLSRRLQTVATRTLRNQVSEYIRFTERKPITLSYRPDDSEHALYEEISEFIRSEGIYSIPQAQKHLLIMIARKLLASSYYAISGTLQAMQQRLLHLDNGENNKDQFFETIIGEEEIEDDLLEEFADEKPVQNPDPIDQKLLKAELEILQNLIPRAREIKSDTKSDTLLKALEIGFQELEKTGAPAKAIIFTESRRTQYFLYQFLSGRTDKRLVCFNGSNNSQEALKIYQSWVQNNQNSGRISGSKEIDIRTALIEHFQDTANIMIATEAAAEGINLQFCSLIINYDLPWNPQRIEQRIGRCHRYGQKFDVVVINFLNERNETDCRVYELLSQKFNLFDGIFGASDEVLGKLESGVQFERRIIQIYQQCRTHEEIEEAFDRLRAELETSIDDKMEQTRKILLEHFDQDVHERLRIKLDETQEQLDRFSWWFWETSKFILADIARFNDQALQFDLAKSPLQSVKTGTYHLISKNKKTHKSEFLYRLSHPLGEYVLTAARSTATPPAKLYFDISNHPKKISAIQALKGQSGWLALRAVRIHSFEEEDYILFVAFSDKGKVLDDDTCRSMFYCRAAASTLRDLPGEVEKKIKKTTEEKTKQILHDSAALNMQYFLQACEKLDSWAEETISTAENDLFRNRSEIETKLRLSRQAPDTSTLHKYRIELQQLQNQKRKLRQRLFETEDEIYVQRDDLIRKLENRMQAEHQSEDLFTIRWTII
ncbi:DEAD/DEAH box helicase [candidate division KSB1 bacterium]|nr:DEAD/DEAH box helicase [candidate division KSB1 bacterium]